MYACVRQNGYRFDLAMKQETKKVGRGGEKSCVKRFNRIFETAIPALQPSMNRGYVKG